MYTLDDKPAAIREVQRFLLTISQAEKRLPHITVDGFYSEETALAVTEFQKIHLLPQTGKVDKITFDILFSEHQRMLNEKASRDGVYTNGEFPLTRGKSGESVRILHSLISQLGEYYELSFSPTGDYYGNDTYGAIKEIQRIFKLEENGNVSEVLITLMHRDLKAREKF